MKRIKADNDTAALDAVHFFVFLGQLLFFPAVLCTFITYIVLSAAHRLVFGPRPFRTDTRAGMRAERTSAVALVAALTVGAVTALGWAYLLISSLLLGRPVL
jgi:hypothetical protein